MPADVPITCNYFDAEVLQQALHLDLGKRGLRGRRYPPVANSYANPKSDRRLGDFQAATRGEMGDVIAFPADGDSGHVGIILGSGLYISARTGDTVGTLGRPPVQPFSGVQIKEMPSLQDHPSSVIRYEASQK